MAGSICFFVIENCDAISNYKKTLREYAQTAEMELIAAQYRGRARVLQAKLFVLNIEKCKKKLRNSQGYAYGRAFKTMI